MIEYDYVDYDQTDEDQQGTVWVHRNGVVELDPADERATVCGVCDRAWDDSVSTAVTPVPAGRCPFEDDHGPVCELCATPVGPNPSTDPFIACDECREERCAECGEPTLGGCVCAGFVGTDEDNGERWGLPTG